MRNILVIRGLVVIGVMSALVQPSFAGTGTGARGGTCTAGHQDAAPLELSEPEMPVLAKELGISGTVKVRVDLDDAGALQNASVSKSSGNLQLDREALNAVRESRFAPEKLNCAGVAGSYAIVVHFPQ